MSTARVMHDRGEAWNRHLHPDCFVCGKDNPNGLGLEFTAEHDGSVVAHFRCIESFSGYRDQLHGGVIASLLDGAMTYCAYTHGIVAVTADLQIRYHKPVSVTEFICVCAWLVDIRGPVIRLGSEIKQGEDIRATASAKFMAKPELSFPIDYQSSRTEITPRFDATTSRAANAR